MKISYYCPVSIMYARRISIGHKDRNSRSYGLDITPVGAVDLVHLGKVGHVGEEDVDLDDVVEVGAGGLEDGGQVLDALVLQSCC